MDETEPRLSSDAAPGGTHEVAAKLEQAHSKPFLDRLESLYERMDHRYQEVAEKVGFHCQGCEDSCCKTTFHHHTLVEYLYIREGVLSLETKKQGKLLHLSKDITANLNTGCFCPLNEEGRCILYSYRPMICRLHGIAHEFRLPNGTVHAGPGCRLFDAAAFGKPYLALDRTEFYWELSKLEKEARMTLDFFQKIKMTISQMLEMILHT